MNHANFVYGRSPFKLPFGGISSLSLDCFSVRFLFAQLQALARRYGYEVAASDGCQF
jgi:hypothetical protein